jgi:DNA-binding transcriptional LysR family regulator
MELRQLRYFVKAASGLSFRQAAEKLYVTQPAISRQIAELERELRVPLFVRDKRRHVVLTDEGELLLDRAQRILELADEIPLAIHSQEKRNAVSIKLAIPGTPGPQVTETLSAYRDRHPNVQLEFHQGETTREVARLAASDEVDGAFGEIEELERHGLETIEILRYEIFAIVHSSHPFAACASIPLSSLASEAIVTNPTVWSVVKPLISGVGSRSRLMDEEVPRPNTPLWILLNKRSAVGLWIPEFNPAPEGTVSVRLEPSPMLSYGFAWRRGESSPAVLDLVELIREQWVCQPLQDAPVTKRLATGPSEKAAAAV